MEALIKKSLHHQFPNAPIPRFYISYILFYMNFMLHIFQRGSNSRKNSIQQIRPVSCTIYGHLFLYTIDNIMVVFSLIIYLLSLLYSLQWPLDSEILIDSCVHRYCKCSSPSLLFPVLIKAHPNGHSERLRGIGITSYENVLSEALRLRTCFPR